jgi:hypothetical protein
MRRGDFEGAWRVSDRIMQQRQAKASCEWQKPRHLQQIWSGQPLTAKRVLVRCYHGLGDTIQFIRFLKPLRDIATEVSVWVQPELVGLVEAAEGADRVLPLHDGSPDVGYDVDIEVMELPYALRLDAHSLGGKNPYLFPGPTEFQPAPKAIAVGVVLRAGNWDRARSLDMDDLHSIAALPGVKFYNLQPDAPRAQIEALGATDVSSHDVLTAARRVNTLHLTISVDTMMAHLAGALGRPIWTLLRQNCDWRWQHAGSNSGWYPTMRLYRQQSGGDWSHPLREIREDLASLSSQLL